MASLPLRQCQFAGEYFAEVTVATGRTLPQHREKLSELNFDRSHWCTVIMDRLDFSPEASLHSLWLLFPTEVGITRAADLTNVRDGGEDDLFIPSFYRAAEVEGFYPCAPDVLSDAAELFADSDLNHLHLAHDPVGDSGGGEMVLTFSRRPRARGLWVSDMRWHPTIQHLLSCDVPWLFCRAD